MHGQSPDMDIRVLSIQSHVVFGYVGNKCCVFPLQLFGFDVDAINSVQFSNHTQYPTVKGTILNGDELLALINGLESNRLLDYSYVMTGYIGSLSFLEAIVTVVEKIRFANGEIRYVCDPVMGDNGKLYVPQDMIAAFREKVIPLAWMVTPNQFEAELITNKEIKTQTDAVRACKELHSLGPSVVVITSFVAEGNDDELQLLASSTLPQDEGSYACLVIHIPQVAAYFTGTGDLMTALLLAWLHKYPSNLRLAVESALAGLQAILHKTEDYEGLHAANQIDDKAGMSRRRELRLVQNQGLLLNPQIVLHAEPVSQQ
eukprot:jgi/Botrbrau1/8610/Bobra.0196s0010.1